MNITQLTSRQNIWTLGKNLAIPDVLSTNVSLKDLNDHQLAQKENPLTIRFFIQNRQELQYRIDHNSSAEDENGNFYALVCRHLGETKAFHFKNDSIDKTWTILDTYWPKTVFF